MDSENAENEQAAEERSESGEELEQVAEGYKESDITVVSRLVQDVFNTSLINTNIQHFSIH